jgi:hypothetical protein
MYALQNSRVVVVIVFHYLSVNRKKVIMFLKILEATLQRK